MDEPDGHYSPLYGKALQTAADRYAEESTGELPYVTRLLAATSLVWQHGGGEDPAIAVLLFHAVEDGGGTAMLSEIHRTYGRRIGYLVDAAADSAVDPGGTKPEWEQRKRSHLRLMAGVDEDAALVIACDALATLRAEGPGDAEWYHRLLCETLGPKLPAALLAELEGASARWARE